MIFLERFIQPSLSLNHVKTASLQKQATTTCQSTDSGKFTVHKEQTAQIMTTVGGCHCSKLAASDTQIDIKSNK